MAKYTIRSETLAPLNEIRPKANRCFGAGTLANGARLTIHDGDKPCAGMRHDDTMHSLYRRNSETLGRPIRNPGDWESLLASIAMGNVSLALPAIHPTIGIQSLPAVNHQPEFTAEGVTPDAEPSRWHGPASTSQMVQISANAE
jgi:metal-dependent amidase/aminoacylase/carboxypeptidase family protein